MKTLVRFCACALALSALGLRAEEESSTEATGEATGEATADAAEKTDESLPAKKSAESNESVFRTLPLCRLLEGGGEVLYPGETEWRPLEEGRFYPLGATYRTLAPESKLTVEFGKECKVLIEGQASFATRLQGLEEKTRSISLVSGKLTLDLPRNMADGAFSVAAPGFTVLSAAGNSTYSYEKTGDGDEAVVRCVTGFLHVKGMHFEIPAMHAADEFRIRTSQDLLFTGLYGTSGDYELRLDQGLVQVRDVEKGTTHIEPKTLVWKLSPRTAVRIHRARPAIGERMSVTMMTFEPSGKLVNRCAFSEGRYELNTGEQGELALKRIEEQSKRAAADAEAQGATAAAAEEPKAAEESKADE